MVGRADAIEMLLDAGADIHDDDVSTQSFLQVAAQFRISGVKLYRRSKEVMRARKLWKYWFPIASFS